MNEEEMNRVLRVVHNHIYYKEAGTTPDKCDRMGASKQADKVVNQLEQKIRKEFKKELECSKCMHRNACTKTDVACEHFKKFEEEVAQRYR